MGLEWKVRRGLKTPMYKGGLGGGWWCAFARVVWVASDISEGCKKPESKQASLVPTKGNVRSCQLLFFSLAPPLLFKDFIIINSFTNCITNRALKYFKNSRMMGNSYSMGGVFFFLPSSHCHRSLLFSLSHFSSCPCSLDVFLALCFCPSLFLSPSLWASHCARQHVYVPNASSVQHSYSPSCWEGRDLGWKI